MKKYIMLFSLISALLIVLAPMIVLAAMEIDFPAAGREGIKPSDTFGPADWIHYLYLLSFGLVGLAIIGQLVHAGLLWMTAGDNSGRISEARSIFKDIVIGFLILIGAYTILNIINPDLLTLKRTSIQLNIGASGGILQLKQDGVSCNDDTECQHNKCDPDTDTCISLKVGQHCDNNTQCASGYCYKESGGGKKCFSSSARSKTDGQPCNDASECAGKYCYIKKTDYLPDGTGPRTCQSISPQSQP